MHRAGPLLGLASFVLFVAPLAYFGELGAWTFEEPVSNLVWDEGGVRPAQSGGGGGTGGSGGGGGDGSGGGSSGGGGGGGGGGQGAGDGGTGGSEGGGSATGTSGGGSGHGGTQGSGPAGSQGEGEGGSGGQAFSNIFAGFTLSFVGIGLCFALFAKAMLATFAALAQAFAWWAWAMAVGLIFLLWYWMGILGGFLVVGGCVLALILYKAGVFS